MTKQYIITEAERDTWLTIMRNNLQDPDAYYAITEIQALPELTAEQTPNPWKDAVLDALATTCTDAPIGTAPRDIINQVVDFYVTLTKHEDEEKLADLEKLKVDISNALQSIAEYDQENSSLKAQLADLRALQTSLAINQPIWPNNWSQPVAMIAYEFHLKQTQLANAQKDAARYQWLWSGFTPMGLSANGNHPWIFRTSPSELRGATLNQAIDAAMQLKEQTK